MNSKRTILRDIEQISMAGIPVKSLSGANGGYSIMEGFKLDGRLISAEDQTSITTALEVGRRELNITLLCKAEAKVQICEYLGGWMVETLENGGFIMRMYAL